MGAVDCGAGRTDGVGRLGFGALSLADGAGGGLRELAGLPEGEEGFQAGEDAQEASVDEGDQHGAQAGAGRTAAQVGGDAGDLVGQVVGLGCNH